MRRVIAACVLASMPLVGYAQEPTAALASCLADHRKHGPPAEGLTRPRGPAAATRQDIRSSSPWYESRPSMTRAADVKGCRSVLPAPPMCVTL